MHRISIDKIADFDIERGAEYIFDRKDKTSFLPVVRTSLVAITDHISLGRKLSILICLGVFHYGVKKYHLRREMIS
jgi:hypothetical protein